MSGLENELILLKYGRETHLFEFVFLCWTSVRLTLILCMQQCEGGGVLGRC